MNINTLFDGVDCEQRGKLLAQVAPPQLPDISFIETESIKGTLHVIYAVRRGVHHLPLPQHITVASVTINIQDEAEVDLSDYLGTKIFINRRISNGKELILPNRTIKTLMINHFTTEMLSPNTRIHNLILTEYVTDIQDFCQYPGCDRTIYLWASWIYYTEKNFTIGHRIPLQELCPIKTIKSSRDLVQVQYSMRYILHSSAVFQIETDIPALYFTNGISHTVTITLKSDIPVHIYQIYMDSEIKLQLNGNITVRFLFRRDGFTNFQYDKRIRVEQGVIGDHDDFYFGWDVREFLSGINPRESSGYKFCRQIIERILA